MTILQRYTPTKTCEFAFYEQLHSAQGRLPKGDVVIVPGDLNVKVASGNTLLGYVMGNHGLGDRNHNGWRLVDFWNYHRLVIGGTLFYRRACHKVSGVQLTDTVRPERPLRDRGVGGDAVP